MDLPITSHRWHLTPTIEHDFWKHCNKRWNCSKQALSPFIAIFSTLYQYKLGIATNIRMPYHDSNIWLKSELFQYIYIYINEVEDTWIFSYTFLLKTASKGYRWSILRTLYEVSILLITCQTDNPCFGLLKGSIQYRWFCSKMPLLHRVRHVAMAF